LDHGGQRAQSVRPQPAACLDQRRGVFRRFTGPEQLAVQTAATANAQLGIGLTLGLAQGYVIFNGPLLVNWMAGLVTARAITSDRATIIMTP
jgi:hypothetical protein